MSDFQECATIVQLFLFFCFFIFIKLSSKDVPFVDAFNVEEIVKVVSFDFSVFELSIRFDQDQICHFQSLA